MQRSTNVVLLNAMSTNNENKNNLPEKDIWQLLAKILKSNPGCRTMRLECTEIIKQSTLKALNDYLGEPPLTVSFEDWVYADFSGVSIGRDSLIKIANKLKADGLLEEYKIDEKIVSINLMQYLKKILDPQHTVDPQHDIPLLTKELKKTKKRVLELEENRKEDQDTIEELRNENKKLKATVEDVLSRLKNIERRLKLPSDENEASHADESETKNAKKDSTVMLKRN